MSPSQHLLSHKAYKYTPLPTSDPTTDISFRVLSLSPGPANSPLYCTIQEASLQNPPKYEALSYTWGDPKSAESSIPCHGDPYARFLLHVGGEGGGRDEGFVTIGYNLYCALQQIRSASIQDMSNDDGDAGKARMLWVDAICINQFDNAEKSLQVASMAKIFSSATRVLAWLGEEDEFVDPAFDALEELCWSVKAVVWRYTSGCLGVPVERITEDDVQELIEFKRENELDVVDCPWSVAGVPLTKDLMGAFRLTPPFTFNDETSLPEETRTTFALGETALSVEARTTFGLGRTFAHSLTTSRDIPLINANFRAICTAINEVFSLRSYWCRLWIVQEFIHANSIILLCGARQFPGSLLSLLTLILSTNRNPSTACMLPKLVNEAHRDLSRASKRVSLLFDNRAEMTHLHRKKQKQKTLSTMIEDFGPWACSEVRDNIFALLNISRPIPVTVDYSTPVAELFMRLTRAIIRQDRNLDILFLKPYREKVVGNTGAGAELLLQTDAGMVRLPSWTPRFHATFNGGPLGLPRVWKEELGFCAGGPFPEDSFALGDHDDSRALKVMAVFTGRVVRKTFPAFDFPVGIESSLLWEKIIEVKLSLDADLEANPRIAKPQDRVDGNQGKTPAISHLTLSFFRTLLLGIYPSLEQTFQHLLPNSPVEHQLHKDITSAMETSQPCYRLKRRIRRTLDGKMVCVLDNGELCLVYGDVEVGDQLFVAKGASVVMVNREMSTENHIDNPSEGGIEKQEFELIGGAYLEGVMMSEMAEEIEKKKQTWSEITLV